MECAICIDAFVPRQLLRKLPCAHLFHDKCITEWISTGDPRCPICRYNVLTREYGGESRLH